MPQTPVTTKHFFARHYTRCSGIRDPIASHPWMYGNKAAFKASSLAGRAAFGKEALRGDIFRLRWSLLLNILT